MNEMIKTPSNLPAINNDLLDNFVDRAVVLDVTFVTYKKGVFGKGQGQDPVPMGSKFVPNVPEVKAGWLKWVSGKVVETRMVPKTRVRFGVFFRLEGSETEPLGVRIVEGPESTERFELRDPHSGFVAYAPVGSIKAGETLARTGGNGKTIQCSICHGPNLEGVGPVPGIAGRSPSYLVRQLYDMQMGTRKGVWAQLMKPVVEKLTAEDLVALGAYTASLSPQAAP